MAISIEDKKRKAIDKRSQAIMSKIYMLLTIDGSDIPEIESQKFQKQAASQNITTTKTAARPYSISLSTSLNSCRLHQVKC